MNKRTLPKGSKKDLRDHAMAVKQLMIDFTQRKLRVVPSAGKRLFMKGWPTRKLSVDDIRNEFERWRDYSIRLGFPLNFAVVTGSDTGLTVLDVDTELNPEAPYLFYEEFIDDDRDVYVVSGGLGLHAYYRYVAGLKSGVVTVEVQGRPVKVEIKGWHHSITAPGSLHPETGRLYKLGGTESWRKLMMKNDTPARLIGLRREMPKELEELLREAQHKPRSRSSVRSTTRDVPIVEVDDDEGAVARNKKFRELLEDIVEPWRVRDIVRAALKHRPCAKGSRTADLTRFMGSIRGKVATSQIADVLWAYTRCYHYPPIGRSQIDATARSAMKWKARRVSMEADALQLLETPRSERELRKELKRDRKVVHALIMELLERGLIASRGSGRGRKLYKVPTVFCRVSGRELKNKKRRKKK